MDHSKERSILLNGSVQIRETHFRDGAHYTISKPEVGDVSGSVTVTNSTTYTGYENAPPNTSTSDTTTLALADITNGMGGDAQPARSSESILEEYRDRSEQVARLQDALASETNPDVRDYYQLQIDTHNNILTTLTTEALAASTTQAQTTAANNPISQQTWDGGATDSFIGQFPGAFVDTFASGQAYNSLRGATLQMSDIMMFGFTDELLSNVVA